jgi:Mg-chelatase subunit ChlD
MPNLRRLARLAPVALVLAVGAAGAVLPADAGSASSACQVSGSGEVAPVRIRSGDEVSVAVRMTATCADGQAADADIFLVLDRSGSMGRDGKLEAARAAGRLFVEGVDFARHQVGLVAFDSTALVVQGLTDNPERVLRAIEQIDVASMGTDVAEAIALADREMDLTARPATVRVLVLLTDGNSAQGPMLAAAAAAREKGTVIFAVALGGDADRSALGNVASSRDHLAVAGTAEELLAIYQRIASTIARYRLTNARLVVTPAGGAVYSAGSSLPSEPANLSPLVWRVPVLGEDPTEFTYRTRLNVVGEYPPAASLRVEYFDSDAAQREARLAALPSVMVLPPPEPLFLPVAVSRHCVSRRGGVDAVLAVDVSESMTGDKLHEAVRAAGGFVRRLDPRRDRAGVVAYSTEAHVAQALTADFGAVDTALVTLVTSPGTRIDRGLEAATSEVMRDRRAGAQPVIIVLSDGQQDVERSRAIGAAAIASESGILVYSIALGDDADFALLEAIAGDAARALVAREQGSLDRVFLQLAGLVRCN